MKSKQARTIVILAALLLGAAGPVVAASPTLVVVIVVDQLRGDYLDAFGDHFAKGGFRHLMDKGAWLTHAEYNYGALATGPGHASLLTGSTPSSHGIVGNNWYALDEAGAQRYCCGDDSVQLLGKDGADSSDGRSPRPLMAPTLGECLKKKSSNRSKVWSVSLKDRAAVLTVGRGANGALWWDSKRGNLLSSTYYGALPAWAAEFNAERFSDRFFHQPWNLLLPESVYTVRFLVGAGEDAFRTHHPGTFPKVMGRGMEKPGKAYYGAVYASPFGNEIVLEAARRAVTAEQLGRDGDTDLLVVGLSANDAVGHLFGPESREVMDCTVRTDRQLAAFFTFLDEAVGLDQCLLALASDHGVGPITEYAEAAGVGGGRLKSRSLIAAIDAELKQKLGLEAGSPSTVRGLILPWLYLNEEVLRDAGVDLDLASRRAAEIAARQSGVAEAFASCDIVKDGFVGSSELRLCVRNSYFPRRSGHAYLHWARYWYKEGNLAGHGSAYDYDRHVPVLIAGAGVRPGRYAQKVCPTGMMVTLCKLLDVPVPKEATGELYRQILK